MKRVLNLNFKTGLGRNMRVTLDDPKEDIEAGDIRDAMELIIDKGIFNVEGGLAQVGSASIVTTQTEEVVFE